jgi:hypothetical protein
VATTSSRKVTDHPRRKVTDHPRRKGTEHLRRKGTEVATEAAMVVILSNPDRTATSSRSTCSSRCTGSLRHLVSVAEAGVWAAAEAGWARPAVPLLV